MKKLPLSLILLAGMTILPPAQLQAQDLAIVYTLTPKSGNGPAVRAALADYTDWLRQQNDDWGWGGFQVIQGENIGDWRPRPDQQRTRTTPAMTTPSWGRTSP